MERSQAPASRSAITLRRSALRRSISGLGMRDRDWTTESIRPLVLETIEAFGAHRAMFASNFPVDKLTSTYLGLWRAFDLITTEFTEPERANLFRVNATRIYRVH